MELLTYWNLRERPFENTWDTRFFFQSRDHDEALSRLAFLVTEQTMLMGMLTGDIGCGKTITRAVFAERLDARRYHIVTQENSAFTFSELLESVLKQVPGSHGEGGQTKYARYERLRQLVERLYADGRHLVLIFDEAQEMSPATLGDLKLLTNWNGAGMNYLTLILVGQPELRDIVGKLAPIDQRISLRFHLQPLDLEETANYLRHRLKVAGHPTGELFEPGSVEQIFQVSHGIPREVNRIAKLGLELSWLKEQPYVAAPSVEAVIRDLQRHQNLPRRMPA
jgi:general secretion pathway protein A